MKTINEIKKEIEKLKPFLTDIDYSGDIDIDCLKLKAQLQTTQDILDVAEEIAEPPLGIIYLDEFKQKITGSEEQSQETKLETSIGNSNSSPDKSLGGKE